MARDETVNQHGIIAFEDELNHSRVPDSPDFKSKYHHEKSASRISFLPQETKSGELYVDPKDLKNHLSKQ